MIFCAKTITEVYSFEKTSLYRGGRNAQSFDADRRRAADYSDLKPHWAEQAMEFAVQSNLMDGISEYTFAADAPATRACLGAGAVPHGARACI